MYQEPSQTNNSCGQSRERLAPLVLKQITWTFCGIGAQSVLQLLVLGILARLLSPTEFGVIAAALIFVSLGQLFSEIGIGPAIVQKAVLRKAHLRTAFTISLMFGFACGALLAATAPVIAKFFRIENLTPVVRALSISFPIQAFSVVGQALLQRNLQFKLLVGIRVVSYFIGYAVVGIVLAYLQFGVWALVVANLGQTIISTMLILIYQRHPMLPQLKKEALHEFIYFSGGITLGRIFNQIAVKGAYFVIGRWLGAEALGIYGRAYRLMEMPSQLFANTTKNVVFAAMARIQDEESRLLIAYRRGLALTAMLVMPASLCCIVLAPEIVHVVLGKGWAKVVLPLQILAFGMFFRTSYKVSDVLAIAKGAVYRKALRDALYGVLVVSGAIIGQSLFGVPGVAFCITVALFINFVLTSHLASSITMMGLKEFGIAHIPAIGLSGFSFIEVWLISSILSKHGYHDIVILTACLCIVVISLFALIYFFPSAFLGKDGKWFLANLRALFLHY